MLSTQPANASSVPATATRLRIRAVRPARSRGARPQPTADDRADRPGQDGEQQHDGRHGQHRTATTQARAGSTGSNANAESKLIASTRSSVARMAIVRCPPTSRQTQGATSSYRAGESDSGPGSISNRSPSATLTVVRPTRPIAVEEVAPDRRARTRTARGQRGVLWRVVAGSTLGGLGWSCRGAGKYRSAKPFTIDSRSSWLSRAPEPLLLSDTKMPARSSG